MNEQEYLEFPWSMEDTVENMKFIKEVEQERMLTTNLDGMGEKDAEELGFDFDRAIEALEKQIPKKPIRYQGTARVDCSICGNTVSGISGSFGDWCSRCGNRIDWSEE